MSADHRDHQKERQMRSTALKDAARAHKTSLGMVLVGLLAAGFYAAKRNRT